MFLINQEVAFFLEMFDQVASKSLSNPSIFVQTSAKTQPRLNKIKSIWKTSLISLKTCC